MDFQRYLASKKTVDDRAINRYAWEHLKSAISAKIFDRPLRVLELGCGIGTMVERLLKWDLADKVIYLGIDAEAENIQSSKTRILDWGGAHGYQVSTGAESIVISKDDHVWQVIFQQADAITFQTSPERFDLLIAQAFLDLIDIPSALPAYKRWLAPSGLFYFTINFDGETIFEPVSNPELETKIINLYHQSMDDRIINGQPSGDSQTGRHLFHHLKKAGANLLAAGSSDWVVFPNSEGYFSDEAYFLHCILEFIEETLKIHPKLNQSEFKSWLTERRRQIKNKELIYIAHQLDFLGSFS